MNKSIGLRIVIYTRNTATEQSQGRYQYRDVSVLKSLYERNGYPINKIYREPSSKIHPSKRPELKKLLNDADKNLFDVVLVRDVFTLSSNGSDLHSIEEKLAKSGVELCSASESFDTSTKEGRIVFEYMCELIKHEHLATKQDMPLSNLAKLLIEKDLFLKGGEWNGSTKRNAS